MSIRKNPVAYIALFIALGGSAYAATAVSPNSVGTVQLRQGAVTAGKVRRHALTASVLAARSVGNAQLQNGSVNAAKVAPHSLLASDFAAGSIPTPSELTTHVMSYQVSVGSGGQSVGASSTLPIDCPAGQQAVGGGFDIPTNDQPNEAATASEPLATSAGVAYGWQITFTYTGSAPHSPLGSVYVVCAVGG